MHKRLILLVTSYLLMSSSAIAADTTGHIDTILSYGAHGGLLIKLKVPLINPDGYTSTA